MMVAMFKRRHELSMRPSSAIVPSAQVQSSMPYVQSPLRENVSVDECGSDNVVGEHNQDVASDTVTGMYGWIIGFSMLLCPHE
jgi:hypothetical protein